MAILGSVAPVVVMGLVSVLTLSFTPDTVIDSDSSKGIVEQSNSSISMASNVVIDSRALDSDKSVSTDLPSVDLPVVEVNVVNEHIEKINNIKVEAPVLGQIGVKGFKTVELGEYTVKAYCGGKCCNQGVDAKGMRNYEGINIAVDANVIPYGTMVLIDGVGIRQAQPTNQKVEGREIRVYVSNHNKVKEFGEKTLKVVKVV